MIRRPGPALAFALVLAGLGALGYWLLFSHFATYDDEGYILLSAREYLAHGRLYDGVYSQYGPAFYVVTELLQRVTGPVDHTLARLMTLTLWLGAAGSCAALVQRQTASRRLALFTLSATFLYLYFLPDEPFHPGGLIVGVLAFSLWLLANAIEANRWTAVAAIAGATVAVLTLTKINVGALYLVGVLAWAARYARGHARCVTALWISGALVLFAAALMHTLLRDAWVQIYLALFTVGAITVISFLPSAEALRRKHAAVFAAVGAGTSLIILAAVWLRGTSASGLIEGVLLGPLRHPTSYSYPVDWRPGSLVVAAFSLALAGALPWIRRRTSDDFADRIVVALRLTQLAALLVAFALLMHARVIGAVFSYAAPLIWTWVVPLRGAGLRPAALASRGLLAAVLLLQYLHAYPVGGSQESWGTFLFVPLVALGLGEIRGWAPAGRWWPALASGIAALMIAKVAWAASEAHAKYASGTELGLPGAERLHLPEPMRAAYRVLALNAVVHADTLFSEPGMFSFNLWTGLPPPTGRNTTLWFTLLNATEQRAIIDALARSARPAVIVQDSLIELTRHSGVTIGGLLHEHLAANFSPVFRTEGFAFWVRKGREIAALNIAQFTPLASPVGSANAQLDFCLVSDGTPIASIAAHDLATPSAPPLVLSAANARVTTAPVDRAGHAGRALADAPWPLRLQGLTRVSIQFHRAGATLSPVTTVIYLKAADGRVLGEIRLAE